MASKKRKKQQRYLWLGSLAVALGLGILLLVLALPRQQSLPEPSTTPPPPPTTEATLPPNPYGSEDFQYDGEYLTCLTGESRAGIDVSAHQGEIDWQQVADAGIRFAMIRVGYRGYETGVLKVDDYARENLTRAAEAGLELGVYFFSQAITPEEAVREANFVLAVLKDTPLELGVAFDWEYVNETARTAGMDSRTLTECAVAFCETIRAAGYEPMIYFNRHVGQELLILEELTDYPWWLAMYDEEMTWPYRISMWQYSETGSVPGIDGYVDLNIQLS